jgi:iron complex transport system substrate-binding protein
MRELILGGVRGGKSAAALARARDSLADGARKAVPIAAARAAVRRACLALLLALLPLAAGARLLLTDDRGAVVELAAPPARIVSLLPSLTETVCVLGACDKLVGIDRFSNWPAQVNALPRLGGIDDLQLESLLRLKPDVVLASVSHRMLDRLESLGVPVLALRSETHADVQRSFERIAALLGEPARARRAWAQVQAAIAQAAARVPPAWRGARAYVEVGGGWAAGPGSFIGETVAALGLANAADAALGPFPKLNPEHAVRLRPDLFIANAREARALAARPGWAALPAIASGRVCALPQPQWELLVRPGPRLGEGAAALADCLAALPRKAGDGR